MAHRSWEGEPLINLKQRKMASDFLEKYDKIKAYVNLKQNDIPLYSHLDTYNSCCSVSGDTGTYLVVTGIKKFKSLYKAIK